MNILTLGDNTSTNENICKFCDNFKYFEYIKKSMCYYKRWVRPNHM